MSDSTLPALEQVLDYDPNQRGLVALRARRHVDSRLALEPAARSLVQSSGEVAIVTGFCIATATPPAAETDGPPGALALSRVLRGLGRRVWLVSDRFGAPVLRAGCEHWGWSTEGVLEAPLDRTVGGEFDRWCDHFLRHQGAGLSHLVSIERVGPAHTLASLQAQPRSGPPPAAEFEADVPSADRDVAHNMRGANIDSLTAPFERLFERTRNEFPDTITVAAADGGNELGCGALAWELVRDAVASPRAGAIACRVPADHLLIAGVSDWAAYALALATAQLAGRRDLRAECTVPRQHRLIEVLVEQGGAVDGVTGQRHATVDGLALDDYLAPLARMHAAVA